MCYDDLNIENMDWKELLELEGDEDVHATIKDSYDWYWCDSYVSDLSTFIPQKYWSFQQPCGELSIFNTTNGF